MTDAGKLALLVAAALLATGPVRAADQTYDLHVIQSLTGGGSFLGKQEQEALQLQEKQVNQRGGIHGKKLHFIFHDDQSSPQLAVQLANEVIAAKPPVLLGSTLVAACNAMSALMKNGPVMYCFSAGVHPPDGSYSFTAGVSTHDQAAAMVRFFRSKGWTRLALITSSDATGQDADKGFDELLSLPENKDITVVAHPHFNTSDVSVSAQIETIKEANPQAVIAWSTGSPIATVFRGMIQAGLEVPVGTTGGNMTFAQMNQFAGFLPKELYLPSPLWAIGEDPRVQLDPETKAKQTAFYGAYAEAGIKPDEGSVLGWDPGAIVIDALNKLPENVTAVQLHDYLIHLKGIAGINGIYDYDKSPQRGLSLENTIVTRWLPDAQRWQPVTKATGIPLPQ
ncbi:MAG: receptor ligand binding region family protein [Rhodospirillales bacterium]|nr:receptor ligand binding region family protein [Rhodospirillales bacterium]